MTLHDPTEDAGGLDIQSLLLPLLLFLLIDQFDIKKRGGGEVGDGKAERQRLPLFGTFPPGGPPVGFGQQVPGSGGAMPGGPGMPGGTFFPASEPDVNPVGQPVQALMSPGVSASFGFEPPPITRRDAFGEQFGPQSLSQPSLMKRRRRAPTRSKGTLGQSLNSSSIGGSK